MNAPLPARAAGSRLPRRLGDRVRAWRGDNGMTRKSLAAASGVSERYLAQLEAGQGNISVLLLRKLARAMERRRWTASCARSRITSARAGASR